MITSFYDKTHQDMGFSPGSVTNHMTWTNPRHITVKQRKVTFEQPLLVRDSFVTTRELTSMMHDYISL